MLANAYDFEYNGLYYRIVPKSESQALWAAVTKWNGNDYSGDVVIPNSAKGPLNRTFWLEGVDSYAFAGCTGLTSVSFNASLIIYHHAFEGCSGLTSLTIPSGTKTIEETAFSGCSGLQSIIVNSGGAYDSRENCNAIIEKRYDKLIAGCMNTTIPNSVRSIGREAFAGCTGLKSISIPESVTSIGYSAFLGCSSLTSITIPNSVKSIMPDAFAGCYFTTDSFINNTSLTNSNNWGATLIEEETSDGLLICGNTIVRCRNWATSVTIPNHITSIGDNAFSGCNHLTSVIIPNSVTDIGKKAFYNTQLNSVTIGTGVLSIDSDIFGYDSSTTYGKPLKVIWLTNTPPNGYNNAEGEINYVANNLYSSLNNKIVYPFLSSIFEVNGVKYVPVSPSERTCDAIDCAYDNSAENTYIGEKVSFKGVELDVKNVQPYVCYNNPYIKKIVFEHNGNVPTYAFYKCEKISSASVFNQGNIGESAFANSTISGSLTINNTGNIETSAFSNITGSFRADINNTGDIASSAFNKSTGLTRLEIGNNVINLGNNAFSGCTGLASVTISNQGDIGESAFANSKIEGTLIVNNLGDVKVSAFRNITGSYTANINNTGSIGVSAFDNSTGITALEIGDKVTNLGDNSFTGCTSLTSVTIYNRGSIGESAFNSSIINGTLKVNSLGDIKSSAFRNITGSFTANINNTGSIGVSAFDNSSGITVLEIGDKVTNLGNNAFKSCSKLQMATINNKGSLGNNVFQSCTVLRTATLANSITTIGHNAFDGCFSLQSIVIPDAVSSIGDKAFSGCSSMTSAKIGNGVKTIPTYAFGGCSSLTDIQIGNGVVSIEMSAFRNCSSLPTIQIPRNVITISDYVFGGCTSLKTIITDDGERELSLGSNGSNPLLADCPLDSVYIGRNITYPTASSSGYSPFYRNTTLRSVAITDKETEISENEFYGCTNLKNVRIGDGVKSFGNWAFSGCSSLDYFSFGTSVETIGKEAFSDCTAMTKLISKANTPPICDSQALDDINKWECTLMVPDGYIPAYQAADQWKEFFFIDIDPDAINDVMVDEGEKEGICYDAQGRMIGMPQKGINIIRYLDGSTKKVLLK